MPLNSPLDSGSRLWFGMTTRDLNPVSSFPGGSSWHSACNLYPDFYRCHPSIRSSCSSFLGFTSHLTSQVIIVAFYSEREKSDKFCSETLISAWGSLRAVNQWHETHGFSSLPKEVIFMIFTLWKIHRLLPDLNPRTLDPVASMITMGPPGSISSIRQSQSNNPTIFLWCSTSGRTIACSLCHTIVLTLSRHHSFCTFALQPIVSAICRFDTPMSLNTMIHKVRKTA